MKKILLFLTALSVGKLLFAQAPTITSFAPTSARPSDAVTITGTNFNPLTANNIVFFGTTKATVTAASATSLIVTVPAGAIYAPITVLNTGTSLATQSSSNFIPVFSPPLGAINTATFKPRKDLSYNNSYSFANGYRDSAVGDLDGDGKPDLAIAVSTGNGSYIEILKNNTSVGVLTTNAFVYSTFLDIGVFAQGESIVFADMDGDGKLDVVCTYYVHDLFDIAAVKVFRNTSTPSAISFASANEFYSLNASYDTPEDIVVGDLDGDGKPDVAVANAASNTVGVFKNASTVGSISMNNEILFNVGSSPNAVAMGDIDGDNKLELIATNTGSNTVSVLRNIGSSGTISFASASNFTVGSNPDNLFVGDIDGDGKQDLAITSNNPSNLSLLRNISTSGTISFDTKQDFTTGTNPRAVAMGDIDGDGKADLVVPNSGSNTISVFKNASTSGAFSLASKVDFASGPNPISINIADLDNNGRPDLVAANFGTISFSVLQMIDYPPTITSFTPLNAKPGDAVTITGTNFNTTSSNNVVFFGATKATVTAASATSLTVTVPSGATYAPITLLNTESQLAAYSLANFNPIYAPAKTNITETDFSPKQDFVAGTNPISVAHADLDGDGKPDLIVSNSNENTISIYRNTSSNGSINSGSFAAKVDFTTGSSPFFISISDIDGDGKLDIVVPNTNSSSISIFRNTSTTGSITSSSFAARVDFTLGSSSPISVAIGDLDGDGKVDIATSNVSGSQNNISVLRNTSTAGNITSASFAPKVDFVVGVNPYTIVAADLDGDGKLDLATANFGSNNISVLRNTSTTGSITSSSFASKVDFITSDLPAFLNVADLDGDGKSDLVLTNFNSNDFSIFHNTSTTGSITSSSFATKVDFTTGSTSSSIAIGDLNGDGRPDLAVVNGGQNTVSLFRNTSTTGSITSGSFAPKIDFITGGGPQSVAVGDLDGDGKPDLVVANNSTNNISVLRNTDVVLPVSLISYKAKIQTNGTVQLNWLTASETNNSHFEILRSTDDKNFTTIGKVTGAGNSTQQKTYNFIDPTPTIGNNYYQLLQYDNDGKITDLGVRVVNVSLTENEVLVYPNPSSGLITVSFEAGAYQKLELIDLSGRVLISKSILKQNSEANLDLTSLATGIYSIKLSGEGKIKSKQIIKQ